MVIGIGSKIIKISRNHVLLKYMDSRIEKVKNLPEEPGIYKFLDSDLNIIYIGKAKNLRNRVSSYFVNSKQLTGKIRLLVSRVKEVEFTVVDSEIDALLLENSLIKKHQPKYNIMLKDGKTYPSICISNERFPRISTVRRIVKDGSIYFGPYAYLGMMNTVMELIKNLYPLRTCNFNLSEKNISLKKFKVCLEYHVGNCKGPCEGLQTEEDYSNAIEKIKAILKGNLSSVIFELSQQINTASAKLDYEKAEFIKKKLELLKNYQGKSTIVNHQLHNIDVFNILSDSMVSYVNFIKVNNGTIVLTKTIEVKKKLSEKDDEILIHSICDLRNEFLSTAKEIVTPIPIQYPDENVTITVPRMGDKFKLLSLCYKNLLFYRKDVLNQKEKKVIHHYKTTQKIANELKKLLRLDIDPFHIECFDNSNLGGSVPVASMVCFKKGKPSKKDYRHYNIKTVEGPDDFASMKEIVFRRYTRILNENLTLPDLIIIDGGKGQLNAALKAIEQLKTDHRFNIISIAKRLENIFTPGDEEPLQIDKRSPALKYIQKIRNEAHRFAINFHRSKRGKEQLAISN